MKVEIITIGNELTSGEIIDTNSAYMASELNSHGFEVTFITTVGDQEFYIETALQQAQEHADVIIVAGGLGPTADDVTVSAAAQAFGRHLIINKEVLQQLRERFAQRGMEMPLANEKQAFFPAQAEIIPNPMGTANGFILRHKGLSFIFLPGVPKELQYLFKERVIPFLIKERAGKEEKEFWRVRTLKVFGLTESAIADRLHDLNLADYSAALAYLPRFPENHVKITVRGKSAEETERKLFELEKLIRGKLAGRVFATDEETLEQIVGQMLRKNKATLAVAESCTGGLIAHRLTQIPGSSDYFERGIVAYSNQAKIEILKVPANIINKNGAVSAPVAEKMAAGVREISKATLGLAVTGIAGPTGGSAEKPVGTVFIALAAPEGVVSRKYNLTGDRDQIKTLSAQIALDWVRRYFLNLLSGLTR